MRWRAGEPGRWRAGAPGRWLRAILLLGGLAGACTDPAPVSLNQEARTRLDTLYARQARVKRLELDSLCEARFEAEVQRAVDSILVRRRAEEARLRRRITQPEQ